MADDVQITAGSGTTVATDDIGSGRQAQWIKQAIAADGSAIGIGHAEDAAHVSGDGGIMMLGVRQDTPVSTAGTAGDYLPAILDALNRMWVRSSNPLIRVAVTPTISASSAYQTGDVLGTLMTIAGAGLNSGGSGYVLGVNVIDRTQAQRAAMDICFFDQSITPASDNAAWAPSDADMEKCLGVVAIGPYNTVWPGTPNNSFSTGFNWGLPYVLTGSTNLYAVAVVRGTPTYVATTDLTFYYTLLPVS